MGCAPSLPDGEPITDRPRPELRSNPNIPSAEDEHSRQIKVQHKDNNKDVHANGVANGAANGVANGKGPKSIAFEVSLDNRERTTLSPLNLPTKLKTKLAPLENAPKLTADMLAQRQKLVEANRLKEIEKKKEVSRRSSKLRRNIVQAREFEKAQSQYKDIEEKQQSAGRNRDAKLNEIAEKKKLREMRAEKARERARRIKIMDGEEDIEIERDDGFNEDDADSWLGDNDQATMDDRVTSGISNGTDRIYSGRGSPLKPINHARTSAEVRERLSASTTDSFDYAFQRIPSSKVKREAIQDDFFDT